MEKIFVSNVRMMNITGDAINFNLYYENKSPADESDDDVQTNNPAVTEATPAFRDIHIQNLLCRGARRAIVLQGLPEMPLHDITLKDVSIISGTGVFVTDAADVRFQNVQVENKSGPPVTQVRVTDSTLDLVK